MGDPIYLVKWETSNAAPTLLHIQSIADVEQFGISGTNYGAFVLDQATWEQRFGMSAGSLPMGELGSAVPAGDGSHGDGRGERQGEGGRDGSGPGHRPDQKRAKDSGGRSGRTADAAPADGIGRG